MIETINEVDRIADLIGESSMALGYFTTQDCSVCHDLFPKIERMLEAFPQIKGFRAEADVNPALVGAYSVFVVPSIVLFVEGKETIRRARTVSVDELNDSIGRYYDLVFGYEE